MFLKRQVHSSAIRLINSRLNPSIQPTKIKAIILISSFITDKGNYEAIHKSSIIQSSLSKILKSNNLKSYNPLFQN